MAAAMSWWHGRMCAFDLETTSPDPEEARIVTAAVAFVGGGQPTAPWTRVVNPGVEIPQEAIDVHGVTNERARAEGIETTRVLMEISQLLGTAWARGWPVVIFNAPYDLTVLDRELRRHDGPGIDPLPEDFYVVDPLVLDKHLDRYRPKRVASHNLEDTCRVRGATLDGAHDASFDAVAAARLAWVIAEKGRVIRRTRNDEERREFVELTQEWEHVRHGLPALQEYQRRLYKTDAERFQAYIAAGDPQKGVPPQPDRVITTDWPIVPLAHAAPYSPPAPSVEPTNLQPAPDWTI